MRSGLLALILVICIINIEARARRRGGRHRGEGGGGGGEGGEGHGHGHGARRSARLKNILKRVRAETRKTRYGTKFASPETLDEGMRGRRSKTVGLGVEPGFIGGSGYRYGAELASYSVYHRYRKYQNMRFLLGWETDELGHYSVYYPVYYERDECEEACPENTHCEWGVCECEKGFKKMWGQCLNSTAVEPRNREGEGAACHTTEWCQQEKDINMVCQTEEERKYDVNLDTNWIDLDFNTAPENKTCRCRVGMEWNDRVLECQIKLNVNCSSFTYTSPVSPLISLTALKATHHRRGWTTEEDRRRKLLQHVIDQGTENTTALNQMNVGMLCTMLRFGHFEDDPCQDLLRPARHEIATNRTETIEEALENSLLSFLPLNSTELTEDVLEEAFCRDVESYSEVFQVDVDDLHHRPSHCPVIADSHCAVLYDSGSCSGGWRLPVAPGAQRRLLYWSADYKYRNDADLVGVRNGCTFTGFSGDNFDGDSFVLTAGAHDRWVLFAESPRFSRFHESILSFQCNCR